MTRTCEYCGRVFQSSWSDDDAAKELREMFPGVSVDDCVLLCDDCFKLMSGEVSEH